MGMSYKIAERNFKRRYFVRALIIGQGSVIRAAKAAQVSRTYFHKTVSDLGIDLARIPSRDVYSLKPWAEALPDFQRRNIRRILVRANWSPVEAQRISGITRTHFYRMSDKLGIEWPRVRESRKGNEAWRALDDRPPSQPARS